MSPRWVRTGNMTIQVIRDGRTFEVEDIPSTSRWDFWKLWSTEAWEPELHQLIPVTRDRALFVDVGAWVGPITLWAAHRGYRVLAIEPDPVAYASLARNVALSGFEDSVTALNAAASTSGEPVTLWSVAEEWSESTSSLTHQLGQSIDVSGFDLLESFTSDPPALVKMDIEGGEAVLFPVVGPLLRSLRVPVLLSTHPGFYGDAGEEALEAELAFWNQRQLHGAGASWLLTV